MANHSPAEDRSGGVRSTSQEVAESLDLTFLLVLHHGLRRDLRRFVDRVEGTPVAERDLWAELATGWGVFAALVRHCFRWERLHVWTLVAAAEQGPTTQALATLGLAQRRADAIVAMIESSRAVFERLALARDEDAVATLRVRVRAACSALEESLESEEREVMPLLRQHISSSAWLQGQHRLFANHSEDTPTESLSWLAQELPREAAAALAADQ